MRGTGKFYYSASFIFLFSVFALFILNSCGRQSNTKRYKGQHIVVNPGDTLSDNDTTYEPLSGSATFTQLAFSPNAVLPLNNKRFRLVTLYKLRQRSDRNIAYETGSTYYRPSSDEYRYKSYDYFMPGIDILYGYNLINLAHYDADSARLTYLFKKPVLVRTLYYPGPKPDSLHGERVYRNFMFVSVYNEDTNGDRVINTKDLRRFFYFNENNTVKKQLIPNEYSVIRSQYDEFTDGMYVFARLDKNKNGKCDKTEPVHVFQISFNKPWIAIKIL